MQMASQFNFTQISEIDDVIIHIYKFLDFEDQLRLSRVNLQLKCIFQCYVWKEEYASLKVHKNPPNFIVTNGKCGNVLCLKSREYQEFLQTYADDVRELTIQNPNTDRMNHDVHLNYFQNLLSFKYEQYTIPGDDVKLIAERNTNLEELILISQDFKSETDNVIKYIVLQMLNLKRLRVETTRRIGIKLSDFQAILRKTNLEKVELSAEIVWDKSVMESDKAVTLTPIGLNEFTLWTRFDAEEWPSDIHFLNFKSLTELTIQISGKKAHEYMLTAIAETCNCLKKLTFEFTNFALIQLFCVPHSLLELSMSFCYGLRYVSLKQILSQYNIIKFYSSHTGYIGEFEDFQISPLIESLHITHDLPILNFGTNLKEFTWCDKSYAMTYTTPSFPLKHCFNLHTLCLLNCQMNLDTLLELKSLRKLIIPCPVDVLQWSFITQLLQLHSSLREFKIRKHDNSRENRNVDYSTPNKGFATQIRSIEIPKYILLAALDFWIDLFAENKNLKLICWLPQSYLELRKPIQDIVNHRHFPKSVRTIDIGGFHTDCKFIRNHFNDYLKQLQIQLRNCKYRDEHNLPICCSNEYWYANGLFRIILYRK